MQRDPSRLNTFLHYKMHWYCKSFRPYAVSWSLLQISLHNVAKEKCKPHGTKSHCEEKNFPAFLSFLQYLADVEEHLGVTISVIQPNMKVPVNEFDGKVVYGEKRRGSG